ncbi:hypothetical protein KP509_20G064900 [Ceratopteris richardii]|nr:hypothetical protein KP509_20G064900 [Ceratopteris richardii]
MDVRKESHCPVCRRPYQYFPRVCELLHFVISKTTPVEYKRRGDEIRRAEEESQVFSPHFLKSPRQTWSPRSYDGLLTPREAASHCVNTSAEHISSADTSCPCKENDHEDWGDSGHMSDKPASAPALNSQKENGYADKRYTQVDSSFMDDKLTIDDFNCPSCNDLLYRPVVLNCGEVFCKSCLKRTTKAFYCPSCKSSNPGSSVHVCLELHQYLESAFPVDYNRRRLAHSAIYVSGGDDEDQNNESAEAADNIISRIRHAQVGCDGCGMFPIEGVRYRCTECIEKIGFDLCGSCYKHGGYVIGRFNQEHHPQHHMEQICPQEVHHILNLNIQNGFIQRRRQQQHALHESNDHNSQQRNLFSDLDDYIASFIG